MTRQFVVHEPEYASGHPISFPTNGSVHYVLVDPTLLTVSCERIKHAFLSKIDAQDNWRDQIYIDLRRARTLDDTVVIASGPAGRGWSYHVSLPDTVEYTRLVTSIVDVMLLEMANRKATNHSAEIPAWLGYGLSEDIMHSTQTQLVLEPVKTNAAGLKIGMFTMAGLISNSLASAHADLQAAPPLTLDQLSWPDDSRLDGPTGETYRASAQLFLHDLLRLRDGQPAMRAFIEQLPRHLNWQITFLEAFHADFASQLELEKWWALRLADFTGRDVYQTMNPEQSWELLTDIVKPVVGVRTRANELPSHSATSLQSIIEKWDMTQQFGFFRERSKRLYMLRSRVSQELAKLTDDYRRTIDLYLDRRLRDGQIRTAHTQAVMGLDHIAQQTINDLNVLDSIREDLRPKSSTVQSVDARQPH